MEESKANCSSNKGIYTRDVGIQTDISLVNYSDKDGEFSANTCNMLSVDFEGLKIEVTILESRINGEIRVNGDAIDRVRADVAVVQSQLGDLLQHRNCLHNSKDIPNNGEVNLNNNNTLETIAHLDGENKGLSDSIKILQCELKQCKIDLSKTSKEYQNNLQIQRDVSSTALPGRVDEPEHCSCNNLTFGTTLATIESDKASIFVDHSCNDDYPSSDEQCTIDYSCIHHYVSNDEVSTISEHSSISSIHEYITFDEASVDFTDVIVNFIDYSSTPTFQKQLNQYREKQQIYLSKGFHESVEIAPNKTQHKSNKFRRRQSAPRHTYNLPTESYARTKSVT